MKTHHLVSALPLCCLFLAAANQNDCNININIHHDGNEGEGEGATEGEGEGGGGDCQSDADCGPGLICQFDCPPCAQQDPTDPNNKPVCDIACPAEGTCVEAPPPPPPCVSDADCGDGFFCAFVCAQPGDSNGGSDMPIACNTGICEPVPPPPPPGECSSDADCGPGSVCETVCDGGGCAPPTDPNQPAPPPDGSCKTVCVEVDPCFGQCDPSTSFCTILADGTPTCEPFGQDCMSDADCKTGQVCDAETNCAPDPNCPPNAVCAAVCTGVCVDPPPVACNVDSDCPQGETCQQTTECAPCDPTTGQVCSDVCQVAFQCLPPPPPPPVECNSDADCASGQVCTQIADCPPCTTNDPACEIACQVKNVCEDPTQPQPQPGQP